MRKLPPRMLVVLGLLGLLGSLTGVGLPAGATATAAATAPAAAHATATAAAIAPATAAAIDPALDCATATVTAAVHPDGTQGPAVNGDGYGRLWTYPDGSQQLDAPVGWNPANASDQELATFGSPPRPLDPKALAEWKAWASRYHDSGWYAPPVECKDNDLVANLAQSGNWAGGLAVTAPPSRAPTRSPTRTSTSPLSAVAARTR
jgi:hypothetical protein